MLENLAAASVPETAQPLVNIRDLGGIKVDDGVVRPGWLWRSDDPTLSPQDEIRSLADQGVTAVLDLRSTPESQASPHAAAEALGMRAHHLPLAEAAVNPMALVKAAPSMKSPRDVGRWYASLVRSHSQEVVQGLSVMAGNDGGTLFHCAAGKDRTGILAGVVLTLLGAPRDVVVEDYSRTEQNLTAIFARLAEAAYIKGRASAAEISEDERKAQEFFASDHPLLGATPESMDAMLTELGGQSGLMELVGAHRQADPLAERLHAKLVQ
ncbi:tyrosine-protein phosphatase [Nesterenkonia populi]|uniref:tyrosine-protein phosphatase n=1 Tax=Nesterenkonia populi TaxID=1591087 RepID=UPI0011BF5BF2|nr:tyrosine-protein phosphatase [Nesterenkonia populi]